MTRAQTAPVLQGEVVPSVGYVLSMDPVIGDPAKGDVQIRDGEIIAVARSIAAAGVPRRDMTGAWAGSLRACRMARRMGIRA